MCKSFTWYIYEQIAWLPAIDSNHRPAYPDYRPIRMKMPAAMASIPIIIPRPLKDRPNKAIKPVRISHMASKSMPMFLVNLLIVGVPLLVSGLSIHNMRRVCTPRMTKLYSPYQAEDEQQYYRPDERDQDRRQVDSCDFADVEN